MNVKEHYDNHLGNFFSWMSGDFSEKQREQQNFFELHNITPFSNKIAIDLGAGHGLQSISLAHLGFAVKAIDFNRQLIDELHKNKRDLNIQIIEQDFLQYLQATKEIAEVIVCMGDTLTHLESLDVVNSLFTEVSKHLAPKGKVIVSFRDFTEELFGAQRFIPVKSDDSRILTCFLEYFRDKVLVHDILYEKKDKGWIQSVSSYPKLRLSERTIREMLIDKNFDVVNSVLINRMVYMIAEKRN